MAETGWDRDFTLVHNGNTPKCCVVQTLGHCNKTMDDKTNWKSSQELKCAPEELSSTNPPTIRQPFKLLKGEGRGSSQPRLLSEVC